MTSKLDFSAPVAYIRDTGGVHERGEYTERRTDLASAVRVALAKYKDGEMPAIIGAGIQLNGIDAIRSVRTLKDFPSE